jgi:hypothetical protein
MGPQSNSWCARGSSKRLNRILRCLSQVAQLLIVDLDNCLRRRAVLMDIVSKNEENTAPEAIRDHPEMVLKPEDFAGWRINWERQGSKRHRTEAANAASSRMDGDQRLPV